MVSANLRATFGVLFQHHIDSWLLFCGPATLDIGRKMYPRFGTVYWPAPGAESSDINRRNRW